MRKTSASLRARLAGGAAAAILSMAAGTAAAQNVASFNIAPQPLAEALKEFGYQSGHSVLASPALANAKVTRGVTGEQDVELALNQLLDGSGLTWRRSGDTFLIEAAQAPQSGSAAGDGAEVEALIVTAQKREENIQDVPIAISAFSAKDLEAQKIEGGFDLVKGVPNVAFTKTNFTSYNFQIRGVGTQSISATSDPGVAVAFNNTAILQNRLFEQEYLDIERVEVLRGPQGTLYGRNATAGVINVISAKPRLGRYEAQIKGEIGNYDALRLRGMVNVPIGETFAVRAAASWTDREGYTFNSGTGRRVDGRDLWTGRLSVAWEPTSRLRADAIWEHFEENDDRLRTGKQLCHRDAGPTMVGDTPVYVDDPNNSFNAEFGLLRPALFSQGCLPGSLYSKGAFDTPNGVALPFIFSAIGLGNMAETGSCTRIQSSVGHDPVENRCVGILQTRDPYGGKRQSENLREIESVRDPHYRAEADLIELNIEFDVTDSLRFVSQTAYVDDETFSFQDFNRFNTEPVFRDTSPLLAGNGNSAPSQYRPLAPGGIFCDPQIGCTDRLAGFDIAQASAEQFSQEFRLQSDFAGPVNFSLGANYTKFDALIDYYVMYNVLTAQAYLWPFTATFGPPEVDVMDASMCPFQGVFGIWADFFIAIEEVAVPRSDPTSSCPYIDPNPVSLDQNFEGDGHNYFRSKNPYDLESTAVFGELYWNIREDLKLTAGLRYTDDRKTFSVVPSQVLLAPSVTAGGTVPKGYPETGKIKQHWGEWTGRLVLDWKPSLAFTDDTLIYGSFSRGYKGGGANPPTPGFATAEEMIALGCDPTLPFIGPFLCSRLPILKLTADEYDETFEPEFVNAYEIGAKNTLLSGALTLNATGFYYDYTDYQVSQIRDRTAVNENFDAEMWGLELETLFAPSEDWRILANIGYLNTRIADGETSIDIMNRTQSNPDYVLAKPWMQLPSNCVLPLEVAETYLQTQPGVFAWWNLCGGVGGPLAFFPKPIDPNFGGAPYDVTKYDGTNGTVNLNGGAGILADLSGNELPNSPHWTVNVGSQYTFHLANEWDLVVRGDAYWQSQSYHRVYNTEPYDKLRGWFNANLVVWAENEELGLHIEAYVKNLLDHDPITGAFLNSDDTGLTTNVFMLDPRLYGFSVRKSF